MPMSIATKAQKNLGSLQLYKDLTSEPDTSWKRRAELPDEESLLGVYENCPGELDGSILVTNRGIGVCSSHGIRFISYDSIRAVDCHRNKKDLLEQEELRKLKLTLTDGQMLEIRIQGGKHPTLDIAGFESFLMNAVHIRSMERENLTGTDRS